MTTALALIFSKPDPYCSDCYSPKCDGLVCKSCHDRDDRREQALVDASLTCPACTGFMWAGGVGVCQHCLDGTLATFTVRPRRKPHRDERTIYSAEVADLALSLLPKLGRSKVKALAHPFRQSKKVDATELLAVLRAADAAV